MIQISLVFAGNITIAACSGVGTWQVRDGVSNLFMENLPGG